MKMPYFKPVGGGGGSQQTLLSPKIAKKAFKPFISSSLALTLCTSLANAASGGNTSVCTVSGANPSICINSNATDQSSTLGVTWIDDNGYSKFENAHGLLEFKISKSSSSSTGVQENGYFNVFIYKNADDPSFTLATSGNKGLKIGDGSGNLKIQFADATTWNNAQAILNLAGATSDNGSNVALFGNLVIEGGVDKPISANGNHIHTLATFGGDLKGNVVIKDYYGRTTNNSLTFNSGKITGSVSNLGGLAITFKQNGGIGGGVSTASAGLATIDAGKTIIILENGGNIQGGVSTNGATTSITSSAGTTNISNGIATTQGSMTIEIVSGTISGGITYTGGGSGTNLNTITFTDGGSIEGDITSKANGTGYINTATNQITFKGTGNASIVGNLFSNDGASDTTGNVITFNGSGTNSITGNIDNKWSQYTDGQGRNTITFSAGTSNTITGNITADSGANKIEATNTSSTNLITGNITAKANTFAKNTITLDGSSNTINGEITANNGGSNTIALGKTSSTQNSIGQSAITAYNRGINVIELGDSSGTSSIQGDIIHSGGGVSNDNASDPTTYGRNEITFNSDGNIMGDIKAQSNGQGWAGTVKNLITFNGATNSITGDILSDDGGGDNYGNIITFSGASTGSNTIIGDITSKANAWGTAGNNIINFNTDGATNEIAGNLIALAGRNKITFAGASSTHSIAGDIQSTGGENIISITAGTSATFAGNIDNNAGSVSIISNTALSINEGNSIISTYGGVEANTNIQSVGALTINLKSIQVTSNGNPYNTNTIIAKNVGGNQITTSEGIQTNHWKAITNLAINGDASNTTSSVLSSDITNYGSTNIILQDTTWTPKAFKAITATTSSGILTNNGGTTNLVIRTTNAISNQSQIPVYNINANGGNTNIVMQGNASAVANINYGGGNVNLLFASSNDNMTDTFDSKGTDITKNKVLGKIYSDGVKLSLNDISVAIKDESKSLVSTFGDNFRNTDGTLLKLDVTRTGIKDTINISGLIAGEITSLTSGQSSKAYEVTLNPNSAFVGTLGIESNNITLTMGDNSKLVLAGGKDTAYAKIATLTLDSVDFDPTQTMNPIFDQTNTVINLATGVNDVYNAPNRKDFRLLEIGTKGGNTTGTGLVGDNALFQVYVNTNAGSDASLGGKNQGEWGNTNYGSQYLADRVIIHNVGDNSTASTQHLQIVYDAGVQIDSIHYTQGGTETNGNIAVATVVNKTGTQNAVSGQISQNGVVDLKLQNTLQGFDEITSTLVGIYTDEHGIVSNGGSNNTYTTYFVNNARSSGASEANREATATAFGVNYDLYMANFNSLNKRMGELRDNPHTQGAWLRIFNGSQTNDMGLGTKSNYTTFQGGYDYAFGFEGANNYVGLAITYGLSDSKTQGSVVDLNGSQRGVENIKSNAVEVAIYNAYVQDEGWYNDTIAKFSYIFSDFNMMGQSSTYSTNNMAFTISDEFGYRFKLGENKEWYIDPQLEMAFGYFDQSDFVQKLGVATLDGSLDSITTLRTRVGSSFGYNFKNFTENKPVKASLYVGAFYEFDYISGGDVTMTTNLGSTNSIKSLSSDGRVAINVGTNIEVYNNTRIYFDFESSFAGKIRTDYQVNIGARYSFGDSTTYSPISGAKKDITPLKINNESKEATTSEPNTNPIENQAEQTAQ